jgi:hypothetical protein
VDDSGARLFLKGEYYYRHIGELAVSLCVAKTIADVDWREYLEGTRTISRGFGHVPKVGVVAFTGVHPNAGQRRMTTEFFARENIRPLDRLALLTDSELLRGAMVAFGWAMPKSRLRAFGGSDNAGAFRWLREVAEFDETQAAAIWNEARAKLGVVG